jgi:hypothetical protein
VQKLILRTLGSLAVSLCLAFPAAWAADAPSNVMYFYCYGPQTKDGAPPPPKVYVSGVSSAVYTEANRDAASNAFRHFIAGQYSTDFQPRCEYSGTEPAAKRLLSLLQSRYRSAAVMTGWTWDGAASAAAPAQAPDTSAETAPDERP